MTNGVYTHVDMVDFQIRVVEYYGIGGGESDAVSSRSYLLSTSNVNDTSEPPVSLDTYGVTELDMKRNVVRLLSGLDSDVISAGQSIQLLFEFQNNSNCGQKNAREAIEKNKLRKITLEFSYMNSVDLGTGENSIQEFRQK